MKNLKMVGTFRRQRILAWYSRQSKLPKEDSKRDDKLWRFPKGLIIWRFSSRVEISTRYTELNKIAIA